MRLYCRCVVGNVGHLLLMMRSGEEIDHIESNRRLLGRFNYPVGTEKKITITIANNIGI